MKALVNNVNLAYDDHGIGQPVLFLHAFPLNRSMWSGEMTVIPHAGHLSNLEQPEAFQQSISSFLQSL